MSGLTCTRSSGVEADRRQHYSALVLVAGVGGGGGGVGGEEGEGGGVEVKLLR